MCELKHSGCLLGTPSQYYKKHVWEGLVVHVSVHFALGKKKGAVFDKGCAGLSTWCQENIWYPAVSPEESTRKINPVPQGVIIDYFAIVLDSVFHTMSFSSDEKFW